MTPHYELVQVNATNNKDSADVLVRDKNDKDIVYKGVLKKVSNPEAYIPAE